MGLWCGGDIAVLILAVLGDEACNMPYCAHMSFLRISRPSSFQSRVTPLLIGMLILLPLYPIFEGERGNHSGPVVQLVFTVLIALGVWAAAGGQWFLVIGMALAIPAIIFNFISANYAGIEILDSVFGLLFFLFATYSLIRVVVLKQISRHDCVKGGIAIYLLIGLTFMHMYRIIDAINPNAFVYSHGQERSGNWADYLYYSFVTLTTLGYGDIQPVGRFAQSVSITEAIVGLLFIAIFIAALLHYRLESPKIDNGPCSETRSRQSDDD